MFKFLKDKLKNAVSKFSKDIDEEAEDIVEEQPEEVVEEKESVKEEEPKVEEPAPEPEPVVEEPQPEKPKPQPTPEPEPVAEESAAEPEPKPTPEPEKVEDEIDRIEKQLDEVEEDIKKEEEIVEQAKEIVEEREPEPQVEEPEPVVEEEPTVEPTSEPEHIPEPEPVVEEPAPEPEPEPEPTPEPEPVVEEEPEVKPEAEKQASRIPSKAQEKKGFMKRLFSKKEEVKEEPSVEETKPTEIPESKKGFFGKIGQSVTSKKLSKDKFESLFFELEVALLENNVAVEVIDKIKTDLESRIVDKPIPRSKITATILDSLKDSIKDTLDFEKLDLDSKIKAKKPYVICFVGVNGSGKTTSIAKIATMLKNKGYSVVLAAGDTFRAAAIDQLQLHADKIDVKIIKHDYGADAAAVAFDAIEHAKAKDKDVVLIDTAGRLHSNSNLMDELKKIIKVAQPDLTIFVGESITGNDCVTQAQLFNESVGIDGIILTKADVDEKGGAAVSVSYVTKKPILYIGTGQEYTDLTEFDAKLVLENIGLA